MKILWMTWKDLKHPQAGGAEVVNEELAKRLVRDGHEVILIVGGFRGGQTEEIVHGYKILRLGNRYSAYWLAYRYYKKYLKGWPDLVVDEVNTIPFFTKFYVRERRILIIHQLAREIWFYQMRFPLNLVGYLIEPLYLWLLRSERVITISESTKQDLQRYRFQPENINIIPLGVQLNPIPDPGAEKKYDKPTLLSIGAIRPMKRTHHQIKAFEIAKQSIPELQLKVAGDATGRYGQKVLKMISSSPYATDMEYCGKVTQDQKIKLMQKSHAILVTSVKEGWGLIVTEAAIQGTPALVYGVDGLRDSVRQEQTGLVCLSNRPVDLADNITELLGNIAHYNRIRKNAWEWNQQFTLEQSYQRFKELIN